MKVVEFKQCNALFAKSQEQYLDLPVYKTKDGNVTSCWKMSLSERIKALFTGKVFISIMTFNNPLQPQKVHLNFTDKD